MSCENAGTLNKKRDESNRNTIKQTNTKTFQEDGDESEDEGNKNSGGEWDTDLECSDTEGQPSGSRRPSFDIMGKSVYLRACRRIGVTPASYFVQNIDKNEISLAHHGIGPLGTKALACCLAKSTTVEKLDLRENGMEEEGAEHFSRMLRDNCYITELNLSGNNLGARGAYAIGRMLSYNSYLRWLDLSCNHFIDKDAKPLAEGLRVNVTLDYLNLSKNSFCEIGGEILGPALAANDGIVTLILSWNHLR